MRKFLKSVGLATILASSIIGGVNAESGLMRSFDQLQWSQIGDTPMSFSIIWGDRNTGPYAMYLKMPGGGFVAGEHAHTYAYQALTIQGEWEHEFAGEKKVLPVGSHVFQPGNAFHGDACVSKEDCILFIYQDGKGDALFPQKQ